MQFASFMPFYVETQRRVAVLHLDEGENRLNLVSVTRLLSCLDEIEANSEFIAMITIGHDKHFSLGLDLDWIGMQIYLYSDSVQLIRSFRSFRSLGS